MKYKVVSSMNEEQIKALDFNEYIRLFNEGQLIANISRLRESYTAKQNGNLVLINEVIQLCKTYEEDECRQHPNWYCGKVTLDDVLLLVETKTHKKTEYVKKFTKEGTCDIINNYIFLLK